jgi:hypothetical protein
MTSISRRTLLRAAGAFACGCPAHSALAGAGLELQRCAYPPVQLHDGALLDPCRYQQNLYLASMASRCHGGS